MGCHRAHAMYDSAAAGAFTIGSVPRFRAFRAANRSGSEAVMMLTSWSCSAAKQVCNAGRVRHSSGATWTSGSARSACSGTYGARSGRAEGWGTPSRRNDGTTRRRNAAARHLRGPYVFCDERGHAMSENVNAHHVDHSARSGVSAQRDRRVSVRQLSSASPSC